MKPKNFMLFVAGIAIQMPFGMLRTYAQDDIDEPAGDISEGQEDTSFDEPEEQGTFGDSPMDGAGPEAKPETATADDEGEQVGPVWESYNDNLKSVAQEVTKGLRVEDVVEPPTEYHYAAFGKPDPFVPPILAVKSEDPEAISGLEVPIISPLQRYDVGQLKLVGVWQLPSGERKAMIMTPEGSEGSGQGIIARNGDPVGKRAGKILAIGDTFLTIREFKLAVDGTRQYEDVQMPMGVQDPNSQPGRLKFTPGGESATIILDSDRPTSVPSSFTDSADKPVDLLPMGKSTNLRSGPTQAISAPMPGAPRNNEGKNGAGVEQVVPINSPTVPGGVQLQPPVVPKEPFFSNTTPLPSAKP